MFVQLAVWLNSVANAAAGVVLAPIAWLPGWLSATLIGVVTGVLMLLAFKHTSHQAAIRRARNRIQANLLALSLFRESMAVSLRAQGGVLLGAGHLLLLSVVPMLVLLIPMCLLLGQLSLWYQARPLRVGEEAVVTVHLAEGTGDALPEVRLVSSPAVAAMTGPVRVPARRMVCWSVQAGQRGPQELSFEVDGRTLRKELAVGDGYMPTSRKRPAWSLTDVLLHPREAPFASDSPVQSIEVDYPERPSWTSGSNSWLIWWFAVSIAAAYAARPLLNVNL